jgi:hypothetical protein
MSHLKSAIASLLRALPIGFGGVGPGRAALERVLEKRRRRASTSGGTERSLRSATR